MGEIHRISSRKEVEKSENNKKEKIVKNLEDPGSVSVLDNMTETDTKPANDNGASNGDATADILWQMEYYFGDFNLPKDKFLKAQIDEAKDGWISLDIMLKFQRLANLTKDKELIIKALEKLEVRRKPSLPIPDWNDETKKANISRTVYCKGFEKEKTTLDDLIKFFNKFPGVIHVVRRTYPKGDERFFKGSTFVTFKDKDHAQKFLDVDEVKNPQDEVLLRKWQQEYFDEKDAESKEKSKARQEKKKQNKQAKEDLEGGKEAGDGAPTKSEGELSLPTGTILVLEGFKNAETKREDIKEALKTGFEVAPEEVAFVYFNKGESDAKLRFGVENAAKELAKKITESLKEGEKFKVKDVELEFKVLEGQEEADFLEKCKSDIAQQKDKARRGHKRQGGGGRGGKFNNKRQRR